MSLNFFLFSIVIIFMIFTLVSLIFGLIQSIRGTARSSLNSQKAMQARVFFQAIAIAIFGILIYINKG